MPLYNPHEPLDSDLTAIAALTTTSFGRALLETADAAAVRSAAAIPRPGVLMKVGKYFANCRPTNGAGGATKSNGDTRGGRVVIGRACTLDEIGCEVTTAGTAAAAIVRLMIYDDDLGHPGNLVLDAGTVAADSTGLKTIAISQALGLGAYHFYAALQGAPATRPNLRTGSATELDQAFGGSDFRFGSSSASLPITGAAPGTFLSSGSDIGAYLVFFKASA